MYDPARSLPSQPDSRPNAPAGWLAAAGWYQPAVARTAGGGCPPAASARTGFAHTSAGSPNNRLCAADPYPNRTGSSASP